MTKLKSLPAHERPRERFFKQGAAVLSTVELLALIMGSGTRGKSVLHLAEELLATFGSLNKLIESPIEDLCRVKGLGKAKAVQIKAALSLGLRIYQEKFEMKCKVETPEQAYEWVKERLMREKKEIFGIILRDARGHATRWEAISVGTLTQALVHPREVFYPAIVHLAASVILVHNHPSGDPLPSPQDITLTQQLIVASRSVGIPIQDHLIVTPQGFTSLRHSGLSF